MKTLYLHIGTPKTGTTAIQYFCHTNYDILLQRGLCYPDLGFRFPGIGQNRNAYFLSHRHYDAQKNRLYDAEERERESGFAKLEKLFSRYNTVVLSDEHIWNEEEIDETRLKEIQERVAKMGAVVKVIVYLRRQDQVIESYWAQQVKEDLQLSFSKYIKENKYTYFQLDYQKRLQVFANALGKENVIVRCYEKGQYQGAEHTILSDFLSIFGVESAGNFRNSNTVQNVSLHGIYLEVKRLLNQNPAYQTKQNFIVKWLQKVQESREKTAYIKVNYFSDKQREEYLARYESGNKYIAKEFLGREDGILFYDISKGQTKKKKISYKKKDMIAICGDVIAMQEKEIQELKKKLEQKSLRGKVKKVYHVIKRK
ncbi:MAG: hypothetical protein J1E62_00805 [Lachnospiraceae bacterium]|nr:hypothetical protein [Lachnospiraceae bacterium]